MNTRAYFLTGVWFIPVFVGGLIMSGIFAQTSFADLTNRYVVKGNGGAAVPYDSVGNAAADIQTAIDYSYAGETVLVAAATYDTGGTKVGGRYSTNRVYISKAITVRSVDNNPATTIIKGAWDPTTTNGWLAVRCVYMVADSSLVGFTLTNGATITSNEVHYNIIFQDACGGGVCAWQTTSATISNCIITGNSAFGDTRQTARSGGGACYGTYFNCTFKGNSTPSYGGAADGAVLSNCTLAGNSAISRGGGSMRGTLYGCLVSNNTSANGGGLAGWNAAVPCKAYDCTIVTNTATPLYGGGAGGGANQLSVILSNCTVAFNYAASVGGGADFAYLIDCLVISNRTGVAGGGTARSRLTNCIVAYNVGGGSRYDSKVRNSLYYGNQGNAIMVRKGDIVENCTFVGNNTGISIDQAGTVSVVNCISYSNTVNWTTNSVVGAFLAFSNSCTYPAFPGWDASNITNNPLFMAFGSGYGTAHAPGNYRLQTNSPCVNTGTNQDWMTNSVDLDGLPRILQYTVDRGAYEAAHLFSFSPQTITNTVMRSFSTNITVRMTNSSPDIELYWGSTITSSWVTGPSSGNPIATNTYGTLTVTNSSGVFPLGTYVSRMIVNSLTNYPSAMAGYSQTGTVDMTMHVAEFARNPTQVTATVHQFGATNTSVSIWNNGAGDIPFTVQTNVSWLVVEPSSGTLTGSTQVLNVNFTNTTLPLGNYYGTLTLVPQISGDPLQFNVELIVTTGPQMSVNPLILSGSVMMGQDLANQMI
ncbi:choice-of-anchor Q domain-containing protein, partial [Verrucomicrobiota bacterium]